MGHYDTSEHTPQISGPEFGIGGKPPEKLKPLPAVIIRLGPGQEEGGAANEELLQDLINIGRRDSNKEGWSAADFNNLACAYLWRQGQEGVVEAIAILKTALQRRGLSDKEKQTIEGNLKLLKALQEEVRKE